MRVAPFSQLFVLLQVQQSSAKVACSDMLSYHKALTIGLTLMFIQQLPDKRDGSLDCLTPGLAA